MSWTLRGALEDICSLVYSPTYARLQDVEDSLRPKGIDIADDFILTDNRAEALKLIRSRFKNAEGPTAILTGYYGSGKTAILHRVANDLKCGTLPYGSINVDPIEIRLNIEDTLSKFLQKLFLELEGLGDEGWVVEVYEKKRESIGLRPLGQNSIDDLTKALVGEHISVMSEVVQFLEELFKKYKTSTSGQRVIGLIFDELENITHTKELEKDEEKNKLSVLLSKLLDKSVREYITTERIRTDPFVLTLFSIPERAELQRGGWLRPDTAQRCEEVDLNINLNEEAAESLMKNMLRLYLLNVVKVAANDTNDPGLTAWMAQLDSAADPKDQFFTYPIMPDVHRNISYRILRKSQDGFVLSFRAYQVALHTLLNEWSGDRQIDMRFTLENAKQLRFDLRVFPTEVDFDGIIGEEQIRNLIDQRFRKLSEAERYILMSLTMASIMQRSAPLVMLSHAELPSLLPKDEIPSSKVFLSLCHSVHTAGVKGWSVTGDTICFAVPEILEQVEQPREAIRPEDRLLELFAETEEKRKVKTVTQILYDRLTTQNQYRNSYLDQDNILHIKDSSPRSQLVEELLIAFDVELNKLHKIVPTRTACCIGVRFGELAAVSDDDRPFDVSVVLPAPLDKKAPKYADKIVSSITEIQRWRTQFQPLIRAVSKRQSGSLSLYQAFKEALKVMLLLPSLSTEVRSAFRQYEFNLDRILLDALTLETAERDAWIVTKLGFNSMHEIAQGRRLIKVLSWPDVGEMLAYPNVEEVRPRLHRSFDEHLPPAAIWEKELADEWQAEDFIAGDRLVPFEEWSEHHQGLYLSVHEVLQAKPLRFSEVGRVLFGNCQFSALGKANTLLHLFLKIGKMRPLYWTLTDDSDDYGNMKVICGELRLQQELQEARRLAETMIHQLIVVAYQGAPKARSAYGQQLRWLLQLKTKLQDNPSQEIAQQVTSEMSEYNPPQLQEKILILPELISSCPTSMIKLGEFLNKLNTMLRGKSVLSFVVSVKLSSFIQDLREEIKCEGILQRLSKLHSNWNRPNPEEAKPDRLLVKISQEYSSEIGRTTGWVEDLSGATDKAFLDKVSKIQMEKAEENLNSICDWLDEQGCLIIRRGWTRTYSDEDEQRLSALLESAETAAKDEIAELKAQMQVALRELTREQSNPILSRHRQNFAEHKARLQQDDNALSQMPSQLYTAPFEKTLDFVRRHLDEWHAFYTSAFQAQSERIDSWLKERGLEIYHDEIVQAMSKENIPISQLDKELRGEGADPLKMLRGTEATPILIMFAAAQLMEALRTEASNDDNRSNAI